MFFLKNTTNNATFVGVLAIFLWSFSALWNSFLSHIPLFELLFISLGISFLISCLRMTINRSWYKVKQPLIVWIAGTCGLYGNDLFYVAAFKYIPAAHIVVVNYLWPLLVLLFSVLLPNERFSRKHFIAAMMGFLSVGYLALSGQHESADFNIDYFIGYLLVFIGACVWSIYIIWNRKRGKTPPEMIGMYCGIGAIISYAIHIKVETFYIPNHTEWLMLGILGVVSMCIAYYCWDFGSKKGNIKALSVLSYNNVLISSFILILFKQAEFQSPLIIACIGVTFASLFTLETKRTSSIPYQHIYPLSPRGKFAYPAT